MDDIRVVLIGGTSNVGKTTAGTMLANRLGFEYQSTDSLAKHPGRPWRGPGNHEVPEHVVEHYQSLDVDELITSVLAHYEGLWPRIEQLIAQYRPPGTPRAGIVLEGSALWPTRVANITTPHAAALWLTGSERLVRERIYAASDYSAAPRSQRHLIDKFLARTLRFQELQTSAIDSLGLRYIDVESRSPADLVTATLKEIYADHRTQPPTTRPSSSGS